MILSPAGALAFSMRTRWVPSFQAGKIIFKFSYRHPANTPDQVNAAIIVKKMYGRVLKGRRRSLPMAVFNITGFIDMGFARCS
jgi:hypothetical protein